MDRSLAPTARRPRILRASKETSFNVTSALLVNAVIVFLPERLQESPYIINAITAWFALGNILLHYARRRAELLWRRRKELFHAQVDVPGGLTAEASLHETPKP